MPDKLSDDVVDFIEELVKLGCEVTVVEVDGKPVLEVPEQKVAEKSA